MNKQSVILTKWVTESNPLLEDYSQVTLLMALPQGEYPGDREQVRESLLVIDSMLTAADVITKWKLTLEKVEE